MPSILIKCINNITCIYLISYILASKKEKKTTKKNNENPIDLITHIII